MTTHKSNTPKEDRDRWCTPPSVFLQMLVEFGFELDAAAEHGNALCARYFTKEVDALAQEWPAVPIWCNPPYSKPLPWVRKASQAAESGATVVMLLNYDPSVEWYLHVWATASEIRLISGRLAFIRPDGTSAGGNNKPQALFIWRPGVHEGPPLVRLVSRLDLTRDVRYPAPN